MNIIRGIAASAMLAGFAAVGFASPAMADEPSDNPAPPVEVHQFNFNWDDGTAPPATWTITSCGVMCLHVAEAGADTEPWEADAYAVNGPWTLFVNRPDFIKCDDGRRAAAATQYNWDATGHGVASAMNRGECDGQPGPGPISANFTLTEVS